MSVYQVGLLTASDKGAAGERMDESGATICEILKQYPIFSVTEYRVLPDEQPALEAAMREMADVAGCSLILTTGGTGFSPRDVTPEATLSVCSRHVPGIPEAMRAHSMQYTDRAMLSRAEAGIRGKTLIVNLPGSPKAVRETLDHILPAIAHGLDILTGADAECAR